jgi:hypothetical protein
MLIDSDRSIGQFDRALIGSATSFRGAFHSRAGGFAAAMRSLIATGIVIVGAAMATAAQIGMWRCCELRRPDS